MTETVSEDRSSQNPGNLAEPAKRMAELAKRMDEQNRLMAEKLHKLAYIYAFYGALDGLSNSYSMLKYAFDMLFATSDLSSSDEMHDWMMSPEGAAIAATSSITMLVFSMLANHFDDDDENAFKRYIAVLWPYCRDAMKGLKNAYKGLKSTLNVGELLGGVNLSHLIVPVGLVLGGLSVINRLWYRSMKEERITMTKANTKLFAEIKNFAPEEGEALVVSLQRLEGLSADVKKQSQNLKTMGLLSAAYGGVVDGLYLYIGVLGVCSLAPPVLIAMTVLCTIYFVACIATRVYEEYEFQRKLIITQTKVELAHEGKKVELLFARLHSISKLLCDHPEDNKLLLEQGQVNVEFETALFAFKNKQDKLRSLSTLSYTSAFLAGARTGLAAYGSLASIVFAVGAVLSLASIAFPPALLIACISFGMVFLIGFIAHSLIHTYLHHVEIEQQLEEEQRNALSDTEIETDLAKISLADISGLVKKSKQEISQLQPEVIKTTIIGGMAVGPAPQFSYQEWFEVLRSSFSGGGKGIKAVDLAMNSLKEVDEKGHYHETPIILGFMGVSWLLHFLGFGLRAWARGFGRPAIDVEPGKAKSDTEIELDAVDDPDDCFLSDRDNSSAESSTAESGSLFNSAFSFFGNKGGRAERNFSLIRPAQNNSDTLFDKPILRSAIIEEEQSAEESAEYPPPNGDFFRPQSTFA